MWLFVISDTNSVNSQPVALVSPTGVNNTFCGLLETLKFQWQYPWPKINYKFLTIKHQIKMHKSIITFLRICAVAIW